MQLIEASKDITDIAEEKKVGGTLVHEFNSFYDFGHKLDENRIKFPH